MLADLVDVGRIGAAQDVQLFGRDFARTADRKAGAGKRMAADEGFGQAKVTAEVAQLTAELVRIRDSSTFNGIALFGASGAGTTVTIQVGANQNVDSASNTNRVGVTLAALSFSTVSMDVSQIDTTISSVSSIRSSLGAVQNRLEAAVRNLGVNEENLSAAESRIRDVDVAQEMVNFTRLQILSQSGTAMLAQANQAPQSVLSLLR